MRNDSGSYLISTKCLPAGTPTSIGAPVREVIGVLPAAFGDRLGTELHALALLGALGLPFAAERRRDT